MGGADLASVIATADGGLAATGQALPAAEVFRLAVARWTPAGAPLTTFGSGGTTIVAYPAHNPDRPPIAHGAALTETPSGLVAAGSISNRPARGALWAALTPTGALDTSFSGDGIIDEGFRDVGVRALLRDGEGRLVGAGTSYGIGNARFEVRRYTALGAPDAGFGTNGVVAVPWFDGGWQDWARAIVPRDDGYVVAGSAGVDDHESQAFALIALTEDGTPDEWYGTDGRVLTRFPEGVARAADAALKPDNSLVAVGGVETAGGPRWALTRHSAQGQPVAGFGDGEGRLVFGLEGSARAVAIDRAGRIVVLGDAGGETTVVRLLPDGSPDTSFGTDGVVTLAGVIGRDVAIQGDRVVGGTATQDGRQVFALVGLLGEATEEDDAPDAGPTDRGGDPAPSAPSAPGSSASADSTGAAAFRRTVLGPLSVKLRLLSARPKNGALRVRLTVSKGAKGVAKVRIRRTGGKRTVVGTRTVNVAAGTTTLTVSVPLNQAGRALLRSGRRVSLTASVVVDR